MSIIHISIIGFAYHILYFIFQYHMLYFIFHISLSCFTFMFHTPYIVCYLPITPRLSEYLRIHNGAHKNRHRHKGDACNLQLNFSKTESN